MEQAVAIWNEYGQEAVDLIKETVAKGTTDAELALFLYTAKRTGLDPLLKQVHCIKRWNSKEGRETMAIQTGIDGYRLIANRTGDLAGIDDAVYKEENGHPVSASVTVYRIVQGLRYPYTATARWSEYAATKDGKPVAMWVKMPFLMLAKCAEALALRKAFPAELSGVYTHEEMAQADNDAKALTMNRLADPVKMAAAQAEVAAINEKVHDIFKPKGGHVPQDEPTPIHHFSETDTYAADIATLKSDFDQRLQQATTFKEAVQVREELVGSGLPKDWRDGWELRFKQKFQMDKGRK